MNPFHALTSSHQSNEWHGEIMVHALPVSIKCSYHLANLEANFSRKGFERLPPWSHHRVDNWVELIGSIPNSIYMYIYTYIAFASKDSTIPKESGWANKKVSVLSLYAKFWYSEWNVSYGGVGYILVHFGYLTMLKNTCWIRCYSQHLMRKACPSSIQSPPSNSSKHRVKGSVHSNLTHACRRSCGNHPLWW